MKEKMQLNIEKELFDSLMEMYLAQLEKEDLIEIGVKGTDRRIILKKAGDNCHRPFNPVSGRYHNIELGIDEVI